MKHIVYIIACVSLLCWAASCTGWQEMEEVLSVVEKQNSDTDTQSRAVELTELLTVHLDTAGTLAAKLGDKINTVQKLTITGKFNTADLITLRSMSGSNYSLASVNMKGVRIVSADSLSYKYTYGSTTYKLLDDEIGNYMFADMSLAEIILPDSIKRIRDHAFTNVVYKSMNNNKYYFTSIEIPESVTVIEEEAFSNCSYLESVKLPSKLTAINQSTFSSCSDLKSITIPENVTTIEPLAFWRCYDLKSAVLPEKLISIGERVFEECSLNSITLPNNLTTIGTNAFKRTSIKTIEIPASVVSLGSGVFERCEGLQTAVFKNEVTGVGTFSGCSNLVSVDLPRNLTSIENNLFMSCSSLQTINLPEGIITIGEWAFASCYGLSQITLPKSLVSIGKSTFRYCNELLSIELPEGVTSVGENAFDGCSKLSTVTLGSNLTSIASYVFSGCEKMKTIQIPATVTAIGENAFYGSGLTEITIPEKVEIIKSSAFSNCPDLAKVIFSESGKLETIQRYVFSSCMSLKEISLPEGLLEITGDVFYNCTNLRSATIPSTVRTLGTDIFYGDYNLAYIFYNASVAVPDGFVSRDADTRYFNPNLLFYMANNVDINETKVRNVIVNGGAAKIELTSSVRGNFFIPQEFTAYSISYTRSFTYPTVPGQAAGWYSISLPFTPTTIKHSDGRTLAPFNADNAAADSKPFWLRRLTESGFENVTTLEAGIPYIIAMPNNEAYDEEYRISGDVTFSAQSGRGITIAATPDEPTQDIGPNFRLRCNYNWYSATNPSVYVLNNDSTSTYHRGSRFVRRQREALPFEAIVTIGTMSAAAPNYFPIDGNRPTTRGTRTLGKKPSIDDM